MGNLARLGRKWIENYRQVQLGGWMLDKSLSMNKTAEGMLQYALVWDMVMNKPQKAQEAYSKALRKFDDDANIIANYALFAEQVLRNKQKTKDLYVKLAQTEC